MGGRVARRTRARHSECSKVVILPGGGRWRELWSSHTELIGFPLSMLIKRVIYVDCQSVVPIIEASTLTRLTLISSEPFMLCRFQFNFSFLVLTSKLGIVKCLDPGRKESDPSGEKTSLQTTLFSHWRATGALVHGWRPFTFTAD